MEYLKSALASILDNKARSILTMLGIIIGIASVISILAIGNGLKTTVGGNLEDITTSGITIQIDAKKTDKYLSGAEVREIGDKVPEAYGASPSVSGFGDMRARYNVSGSFNGGNEHLIHAQKEEIAEGRFFNETEAESGSAVAVLTQSDAVYLFGTADAVGKTFEGTLGSVSRDILVVGLLRSEEEDVDKAYSGSRGSEAGWNFVTAYVPYTLLTQVFRQPGERVTSYTVYPMPNQQDAASLRARRVTENLLGLRGEKAVTVQSFASLFDSLNRILSIVTTVVALIAAISLIVGGIGVMNIMTVSVTERTREIGIRKSLGARTGSILLLFLAESAMIALIGGIIGMLAGYGLTFIVSLFMSFPPQIRLSDVALVVGISTFIGLFFGIYPAHRAAKLNPIEALRYE